jgi:hypothetical protein
VKQQQAQMAYRAWGLRVDGIDGLASDDVCVGVAFKRGKGPTQRGWSASHLADDRAASVTR